MNGLPGPGRVRQSSDVMDYRIIIMSVLVYAVEKPDVAPFPMPDRFRHEITFFITPGGEQGLPKLPAGEYWVRLEDARSCLDEGVIRIVSPLDSENQTEIEISEDQENWLEWMTRHEITHVRLG